MVVSSLNGQHSVSSPFAIMDIGSHSVRLVIYDQCKRAPVPIFNEKSMCGLGRKVAITSLLEAEGIEKAISTLQRFRKICERMEVGQAHAIATAAVRDAKNGRAFLERARSVVGEQIEIECLSGEREAYLTALGVASHIWKADGIVGDLGGGSLELNNIQNSQIGEGISLPLGGFSLQDLSGGSLKKASKYIKSTLCESPYLLSLKNRSFYAVGGTWRALAKLYAFKRQYPLHMMHAYALPPKDFLDFISFVVRSPPEALAGIEIVPSNRRPFLPYGALILEEMIQQGRPAQIVISAAGVREGFLYEKLPLALQQQDPLIKAAQEMNRRYARHPAYGEEVGRWTMQVFHHLGIKENEEERRLREVACLLSEINWHIHPDYRVEQAASLAVDMSLTGLDHKGRAFLATALAYRYGGTGNDVPYLWRSLLDTIAEERARLVGTCLRLAATLSASLSGLLPRLPLSCSPHQLSLHVGAEDRVLVSEKWGVRLKQFAKLVGREPLIVVDCGSGPGIFDGKSYVET